MLFVKFYISLFQSEIYNFLEKLYKLVSWIFSIALRTESCNSYFVEIYEWIQKSFLFDLCSVVYTAD